MADEDGWTVATGKRTRTAKIYKKDNLENPKKRMKTGEEDSEAVVEVIPEFELVTPPKKKKQPQRALHPDGINMKDMQNLVFWVFNQGINPKWIFLKNKALISQFVIISIGGLNKRIYEEHPTKWSNLKKICKDNKKITIAPGTAFRVFSPLQSFLFLEKKNKKKKETTICITPNEMEKHAPLPPSHYVHSLSELRNHGFPLEISTVKEIATADGEVETVVEYEKKKEYIVFNDIPIEYKEQKLLAIDCEMCLTANGSELTRITVVDMNSKVIYDSLVKPDSPITDYLTQYSGITADLLDPVTTTLEEVQNHLKEMISKQTILVGHSLENDLRAMKVSHFRVIDTSILYPHTNGPPSKNSLKYLVQTYLHRIIQTGSHDSAQDAIAAMELAILKIIRGASFGLIKPVQDSIFTKLADFNVPAAMFDRPGLIRSNCPDLGVVCDNDNNVVEQFQTLLGNEDAPKFIYTQFHSLNNYLRAARNADSENPVRPIEECIEAVDARIGQIYESLPLNSFLVVSSGQANLSDCTKLWKLKNSEPHNWTDERAEKLKSEVERARAGISFFALKNRTALEDSS